MSDVTRILSQIESGDPAAVELLLPLVYHDLRKRAGVNLAQEGLGWLCVPHCSYAGHPDGTSATN